MTTEDAIIDRVSDVCTALNFLPADFDFSNVPSGAEDGAFTVLYTSDVPKGQIGRFEEAHGTVIVSVSRPIREDYQAARRQAFQDARAVLSGLVTDGHVTSGEYAVDDTGRRIEIIAPKGASYLYSKLSVAINFEAAI